MRSSKCVAALLGPPILEEERWNGASGGLWGKTTDHQTKEKITHSAKGARHAGQIRLEDGRCDRVTWQTATSSRPPTACQKTMISEACYYINYVKLGRVLLAAMKRSQQPTRQKNLIDPSPAVLQKYVYPQGKYGLWSPIWSLRTLA